METDVRLDRASDGLKERLFRESTVAIESLRLAVESLCNVDRWQAQQVVAGDIALDRAEVEIEEECLKILALYHPSHLPLRIVVATLKINTDLERVGDLAVNIAHAAAALREAPGLAFQELLHDMSEAAQAMLHQSVAAFLHGDTGAARDVCAADDEVDKLFREALRLVTRAMETGSGTRAGLLEALSAARHLERAADHATNIAETAIYLVDGDIVRHSHPAGDAVLDDADGDGDNVVYEAVAPASVAQAGGV